MSRDVTPRGPVEAMEKGPGPARYMLPPAIGASEHDPRKIKAPQYSMGAALNRNTNQSFPGPSHYRVDVQLTRVGKDGTPKYSIAARAKPRKSEITPGAGAYNTENIWPQGERRRPAYSMASRTRYTQKEKVPGPNKYSLPKLIGPDIRDSKRKGGPSYSMSARLSLGSFSEDLARTPGPARYGAPSNDSFLKRNPQYTLQGRSKLPTDKTRKPGPGSHSPEKVTATRRSAPSFHFGRRHSDYTRILMI